MVVTHRDFIKVNCFGLSDVLTALKASVLANAVSTGRHWSLSPQKRRSALFFLSFRFAFYLDYFNLTSCLSVWTSGFQVMLYLSISHLHVSLSLSIYVSLSIYRYFGVLPLSLCVSCCHFYVSSNSSETDSFIGKSASFLAGLT